MPAGKGMGFIPDNALCGNCERSGSPSIRKYLGEDKIMIVSLSREERLQDFPFKGKAASCLVLPLHMFTRSDFQELQIFLISYQGPIV